MRLIDADALLEQMRRRKDYVGRPSDPVCLVEDAPTFDIFQKLWNALYAEEDKLEKRHINTPEHDNWFLVYRPWLQDGFGIAIKVLSEIFDEPPERKEEKE